MRRAIVCVARVKAALNRFKNSPVNNWQFWDKIGDMSPQNNEKLSISRASKAVGLTILSPAILAISGCSSPQTPYANSSDCDNNRRTPQTEDDCDRRRSGSGSRAFYGGSGNRNNNNNFSGSTDTNSTRSGGFGGIGRFFSGGGS